MTVFGRDASDFDTSISYTGLGFFTHKATEGTNTVHQLYGARLLAARNAGVPVLGSYHVVRTPGSGGAGSLVQQLAYWVANLDAHTPWWRTWPHWVMQVDAEKWSYDKVAASTVVQFASLLSRSGLPGWKVTYASRGQYGDSLAGITTPLWNANYNGSVNGSYPGDGGAGWATYAGQMPVLWQYTSSPYDKNAFRGSLAELLALTAGETMPLTSDDLTNIGSTVWRWDLGPEAGSQQAWLIIAGLRDRFAALDAAGAATFAAVQALAAPVPVSIDTAAVVSALISNTAFLAAIAKAVNDDAAQRLQA